MFTDFNYFATHFRWKRSYCTLYIYNFVVVGLSIIIRWRRRKTANERGRPPHYSRWKLRRRFAPAPFSSLLMNAHLPTPTRFLASARLWSFLLVKTGLRNWVNETSGTYRTTNAPVLIRRRRRQQPTSNKFSPSKRTRRTSHRIAFEVINAVIIQNET